jgi:hypothetical protein
MRLMILRSWTVGYFKGSYEKKSRGRYFSEKDEIIGC